ncbi:class I SAM-dependent methyltransferase [Bacillus aquiflavi]|uniref:Class I SAM-dependent methyltransferase n=1 Tax=Bacillus aquiflavi TaxID=2672567 RepID=A0A6B3W408_9BACI|nr:class I SAM-dependent methyltransferase [Bacillus aquiflavi]MBA4537958.1 class I SAM-dependent methyltransferase [Bacillus aquiflavi]NEY82214.1 class I SAM-dependent methyltransferase [Bacillus aquiflavi]
MSISPTEKLFSIFDQTALMLEKELSCSYLEAIAETGENLFHKAVLQDEISEITVKRIKKQYEQINLDSMTNEEIRKAYQLAILKGMKQQVQSNHQMTPDGVGMLVSYLVSKFMGACPRYRLLDPAIGTGNLLTTVLNGQTNKEIESIGIDIDDVLIKLAYVNANLQKHSIELFNQDSLELLFVDPVDVVVSDLPVGYYPNDLRASEFKLKADEGHSFAHHLFIEQSCRYVKPGGYLFFIIPNHMFKTSEAPKLHQFIQNNLIIQGLLQLPLSMFTNEQAGKSIFILQKNKEGIIPPKQVLLVDLPSFSNSKAIETILYKINNWFKENKQVN